MNQWKICMTQGVIALISSLTMSTVTLAQTPAKRAILILQNEAAALMGTFSGNVVVADFSSVVEGQQVVGYTAVIQHSEDEISLTCAINLDEQVRCDSPTVAVIEHCSSGQPQEDIWVRQFVQNSFSSINDYTVRLYRSVNDSFDEDHLCINVYDVRNRVFMGTVSVRLSANATTYYSVMPLEGVDYQIVLNSDGSYTFRRSQGTKLLYEGYSQ